MSTQSTTIVQRLWNYCSALRDDGVSYGDYVEQLTYLLFLKMDDEQVREPGKDSTISAAARLLQVSGNAIIGAITRVAVCPWLASTGPVG